MTDPAFLMLIQHLQHAPPAITRSAPVELGGDSATAYATYVAGQERTFQEWIEHGRALRTSIWSQVEDGTHELTSTMIDEMIELHDRRLEDEARALRRLEKRVHRNENELAGRQKTVVVGAHQRLIDVARRFYDDKHDFGIFLRAVRAEVQRDRVSNAAAPLTTLNELRRFLVT